MTDDLEVLWLNDPEPPNVVELVCVKCEFRRSRAVDRIGQVADNGLVASRCPQCDSPHSTVSDFKDGVLVVSDESEYNGI